MTKGVYVQNYVQHIINWTLVAALMTYWRRETYGCYVFHCHMQAVDREQQYIQTRHKQT